MTNGKWSRTIWKCLGPLPELCKRLWKWEDLRLKLPSVHSKSPPRCKAVPASCCAQRSSSRRTILQSPVRRPSTGLRESEPKGSTPGNGTKDIPTRWASNPTNTVPPEAGEQPELPQEPGAAHLQGVEFNWLLLENFICTQMSTQAKWHYS